MHPNKQFLSRAEVLELTGVSDSTERRRRNDEYDWPPHVRIGGKVCYPAAGVDEWLELKGAGGGRASSGREHIGLPSDLNDVIQRRAAELASQAPPLTARQVIWLREVFARPEGGKSR
jgi:predicted DNA-binding transcriptional regulator AlpA